MPPLMNISSARRVSQHLLIARPCAPLQDWNVQKYKRTISRGGGWVSGWIGGRCPGTDPTKLLALQRISFPSLTGQCQPGTSCTACMCQLSKAMAVAKSEERDLVSSSARRGATAPH